MTGRMLLVLLAGAAALIAAAIFLFPGADAPKPPEGERAAGPGTPAAESPGVAGRGAPGPAAAGEPASRAVPPAVPKPVAREAGSEAAPGAAAKPCRLTGRVVDMDDRPVAGAELSWGGGDGFRAGASTGPDGAFEIAVPPALELVVRAAAAGFPSLDTKVAPLAPGEVRGGLIFRLGRGTVVTLRVVEGVAVFGEEEKPVAGAPVILRRVDEAGGAPVAAVADDLGRAVVAGVAHGRWIAEVDWPPYRGRSGEVELRDEETTLTVRVAQLGRIRGTVRDEAEHPVTAFAVTAQKITAAHAAPNPVFRTFESPAGEFEMAEIGAGAHEVHVAAAGFALRVLPRVEVPSGGAAVVEAVLPAGGRIAGRVVSAADGSPVADAIVFSDTEFIPWSVDLTTRAGFRPHARATRTGADGTFMLGDLRPGEQAVAAVHPDFAEGRATATTGAEGVEIRLAGGGVVEGRSFDGSGNPATAVPVLLIRIMVANSKKRPPRMAQVDGAGAFRFDHVERGNFVCVRPEAAGIATEMKFVSITKSETKVVEFGSRTAQTSVTGIVTDRRQGAVAGAWITFFRTDAARDPSGMPKFQQSVTDADGRYRIPDIEAGRYDVHVGAGVKKGFNKVSEVEIEAGGERRHDIVVSGGRVHGVVLGTSEEPLAGAEVLLLRSSGGAETAFAGRAETAEDGRFEFAWLEPGSYRMTASAPGHAIGVRDRVDVGDSERDPVRFILVAGGSISGMVSDESGAAVSGSFIEIRRAGTDEPIVVGLQNWGGPDGRFEIPSLPAGIVRVRAVKAGHAGDEAEVEIRPGETVRLRLVLRKM